jgi:hypothetical protein
MRNSGKYFYYTGENQLYPAKRFLQKKWQDKKNRYFKT